MRAKLASLLVAVLLTEARCDLGARARHFARHRAEVQHYRTADTGARAALEVQRRFREEHLRDALEEKQLVAEVSKQWQDESGTQRAEANFAENTNVHNNMDTKVDVVQKTMAAAEAMSQRFKDEAMAMEQAPKPKSVVEPKHFMDDSADYSEEEVDETQPEAERELDEGLAPEAAPEAPPEVEVARPDPTGKELESQLIKTSSVANIIAEDAETLASHLAKLDGAIRNAASDIPEPVNVDAPEPEPRQHHRGRKEVPYLHQELAPHRRKVQSFISRQRAMPNISDSDAEDTDATFSDAYAKGHGLSFALNSAEDVLFRPSSFPTGVASWFALALIIITMGCCLFALPWGDVMKHRKGESLFGFYPKEDDVPHGTALPMPPATATTVPMPVSGTAGIPVATPVAMPATPRGPYSSLRP